MSDHAAELFKASRESQNRYTYFLLAAAVAAIGYALGQTQGLPLNISQLHLGIAILCWGVSFFCGCKHIAYINSNLYANMELLRVESGEHPKLRGYGPDGIAAASEGIRLAFDSNSEKASSFANWQFRLLVWGGLFYMAWHLLSMYILSIAV